MRRSCITVAISLLCACIVSGCATKHYQDRARNWAVVQGFEVNQYNADFVCVPKDQPALKALIGGHRGIELSDLAVELWPVQYRIAQVIDYGVIPAAVAYGLYEAYDSINTGGGSSSKDDNSRTYNITSDGPVQLGDGNSTSTSSDNDTTTTTTTTTEESYESSESFSSYSGAE